MQELFFGPVAIWFTVPAIAGTVFFSLRTLLMLVGGADTGVDVDVDFDVDVDLDAGADIDVDTGESSYAFKVLSVQADRCFSDGLWLGRAGCVPRRRLGGHDQRRLRGGVWNGDGLVPGEIAHGHVWPPEQR